MSLARRSRHAARRVRQTLGSFDNTWEVVRGVVTGADELRFRTGGVTITCPNAPGARVPVYEVFAEDEYSLDWFTADLGPGPVALDIGAHIGCFSIDFTRRHPQARVHSYEPTPSTGAYLERNVADNGLAGRITVNRRAVGASAGVLVMADNGAGSGHNGVLHLGEEGAVSIEVPCEAIEDAFAAAGGGVDFVKMDSEGAEYDIVLGSRPEVWAGVRRLVMEHHPSPEHDFADLERFLADAGLRLVRHEVGGPGFGLAWFSRDEVGAA